MYFAVRVGKKPGIYTDRKKCNLNVIGISGADYKKFNKKNDAEKFLNNPESPTRISNRKGFRSKNFKSPPKKNIKEIIQKPEEICNINKNKIIIPKYKKINFFVVEDSEYISVIRDNIIEHYIEKSSNSIYEIIEYIFNQLYHINIVDYNININVKFYYLIGILNNCTKYYGENEGVKICIFKLNYLRKLNNIIFENKWFEKYSF